jgi:Membrane protein putatively involved in post-translational modification of the autoinducing quorum-sensing peptide
MIEAISNKLAIAIKSASKNEQASVAVIRFGLILIINTIIIVISCFVLGLILGKLAEVMLALLSFAALRSVSGGFHLKSNMACIVLSVCTMIAIPFVPLTRTINLSLTVASLLLILIYAPSNIEKQTRVPERYFFAFKIISLLIASTNLFLQTDVMALAFFIQSLSLIRKRR